MQQLHRQKDFSLWCQNLLLTTGSFVYTKTCQVDHSLKLTIQSFLLLLFEGSASWSPKFIFYPLHKLMSFCGLKCISSPLSWPIWLVPWGGQRREVLLYTMYSPFSHMWHLWYAYIWHFKSSHEHRNLRFKYASIFPLLAPLCPYLCTYIRGSRA